MSKPGEISAIAIEVAKKCSREQVIDFMWAALQLLYCELAKSKEIPSISDLDKETKEKYWKEVIGLIPDRSRVRKIWACQALYVYDLIKD